jgi:hypothetical protein
MFSRTLGFVAAASLILVACGGDDGGSSGPQCMGMEMSVPGQMHDPCPQDNAACVAAGGKAYAKCENGQWSKTCDCITPMTSTGTMTQPTMTQMSTCGDGVITAPAEKCDKTNLNGASCQSLGFNGGGTLLCNPTTCLYDTIMCRMTTGGGAGMSGGAGMGGGGTGS